MKITAITSKSLLSKKLIGESTTTLPFSKFNPVVNSPYLRLICLVPSLVKLNSKKLPTMNGNRQQKVTKETESTEFIASILVSNLMCSKLMNADIEIIVNDSFIKTICCDQKRLEWILFFRANILRCKPVKGFSISRKQLRSGIIKRGMIIEPALFKKKNESKPRIANLSLSGSSQKGLGMNLS